MLNRDRSEDAVLELLDFLKKSFENDQLGQKATEDSTEKKQAINLEMALFFDYCEETSPSPKIPHSPQPR